MLMEDLHFVLGQFLDIDEPVTRAFENRHDLVELQVERLGILGIVESGTPSGMSRWSCPC